MKPRAQKYTHILVTGADGQLGQTLRHLTPSHEAISFTFCTKNTLDITSAKAIDHAINKYKPDVIINTAAYTAVDAAETEIDKAYEINHIAVEKLAQACKHKDVTLIHISTDYVFDGTGKRPYTEEDIPNPQTVYGASKLAGEQAIINTRLTRFAIVRTSWVYSVHGNNFVKTMLRLSKEKNTIQVVNDQIGSPTSAVDLGNALIFIGQNLSSRDSGIYHFTNEGAVSWYAFAKAIFKITDTKSVVIPINGKAFKPSTARPEYSVLCVDKIKRNFNLSVNSWQKALKQIAPFIS